MKLLHYLILFVLSLVTCQQELDAQVSIEFNSVNPYMFSTKEALNFIALFSGKTPVESIFIGKIYSQDMSPVVEFKTDVFTLQTGGNVITPSNLSFRELNFLNSDIAEIEQKTGTFPSGDYTLCIWAVCANPDCGGQGAGIGATEQSQCIQIHIENPTPLLLSYPEDNSEIVETRPIYTWIPPGPIASSANLNYSFNLVQINDGQTKQDALALNRPLIKLEGLGSPVLVHPYDLPALEEGKSYAWQVVAYVGKSYFATSEQWKFKIKKDTLKPKEKTIVTFKNEVNVNPYYLKSSDSILMVFDQTYNFNKNEKWKINLVDEYSGKLVKLDLSVQTSIYSGLSGILLSPLETLGLELGKVYKLELKSIKGEIFYIRIIFKK